MSDLRPADVLRALDAGEFEFFYQPKVSFLTGRISGCEALIRWRKADGSYVLPGAFLPMAERSGLITEISRRMFPVLCRDQARIDQEVGGIHVAFNVNAHDLENEEMIELLLQGIHTGLLRPEQIQIELTETAVADDHGLLVENVRTLVDAGMTLVMDDFGTGYSSLDALHRLPFSVVKIDQAVIKGLMDSSRCAAIAMASIRMAHEMGMAVVAEGVETEEVFQYLHHSGCTEAQGYWICRPKPIDEAIAFIGENRCWCEFPVGLLRHVEMDHIQWRKSVMDRVLGVRQLQYPRKDNCLGSEPQSCRFGEWFYGTGRAFAGDPMFDGLEEPHRKLHEVGDRLIQAAEVDHVPTYALRSMTTELLQRSEELMRLLQDLEIQALLKGERAKVGESAA
ncbi:MAG: EAL domain-containing protein [Planctomycetes bacterium]|nr:EAL domain-containing protein [Planctomycetota bacterium]MBL7008467.1 EAL domain-containing protein [Planctomycetota bacterium]